MAKRRTRKQKEKAKHRFVISRDPTGSAAKPQPKKSNSEAVVKGQTKKRFSLKKSKKSKAKIADLLAKDSGLASIKRDIVKSLILASFILGLEIMLYLRWR